jgi:hypothetical protein
MSIGNPNIAEAGKLTQFSSENQPGIQGKKKNRFKQIQNDFELSIDDMRQVITDLLSMSPEEIKALKDNKEEPAYRLVIASAIFNCIKTGNWSQVNYMFDRLFGKAKETHELTGKDGSDLPIQIIIKDAERPNTGSNS